MLAIGIGVQQPLAAVKQKKPNSHSSSPVDQLQKKRKIKKRIAPINQTASPITYHGGPVVTKGVNVYYIWYGNWTGNTAVTILTDFMNHLSGSPWLNIDTTYYQTVNRVQTPVMNQVTLAGSCVDTYSQGSRLRDSSITQIVQRAISKKLLPLDPKGAYFVLTSADVAETSGFCTNYCGWHTYATIGNYKIPISFIGNSARCLSACAVQSTSPNNNAGADGMVNIIAHELAEIMNDPQLNAWYDATGAECADKCAWTFGTTYTAANGSKANVKLGTRDYLIQQNWVNTGAGGCVLHYP